MWVARVITWLFGLVFLWAGWSKLQDPAHFLLSVRSFRILPEIFAVWLALGLPWLEIVAGLAVLTGWFRRGGLLLLNVSLVIFAIALASAWMRGLEFECGCFGGSRTTSLLNAMVRDAVLLAVGAWLMSHREENPRGEQG